MEDRDRLQEVMQGADMLFITAGMGGGTGTGAAPVIAQLAKELGVLTVAVVTKPFEWEGRKRMGVAEHGITELGRYVDSLITIPNQKLLTVLGSDTSLLEAFGAGNEVLQGAVQGIAELITREGLINVDFADVRTVMSEMGMAMIGAGSASGEGRAREAADAAISSPLLEDINLANANGVLVNVTSGPDLSIGEFQEVGETVETIRLRRRYGRGGYGRGPGDGRRAAGDGGGYRPGPRAQHRRAAARRAQQASRFGATYESTGLRTV